MTYQDGYTGRLLRINLSNKSIDIDATSAYLPSGIGGRGIAAQIAWNEIPKGMNAFDIDAPLMIITGPLTGTIAPFTGRTTVCGLAPQGFPQEFYTRSSFGGHWGPELKYAGFDGIIIIGRAEHPVYLKINNQKVSIEDASDLWGRGLIETQKLMLSQLGNKWRIFSIGPAGENLVRIAVAATETESASGQGGFGAVMGSKNLKAIAVRGTGKVSVADPERFSNVCKLIREEAHGSHGWPHTPRLDPELHQKYGQRFQACTQGCSIRCYDARFYTHVPSKLCPGKILSGQVDCIAGLFPGASNTFYNWNLGFESGFELSQLSNDLGLNHWEILVGMIPWLRKQLQSDPHFKIDTLTIDFDSIHFWADLFHHISHRSGPICKALGEGTVRAARHLKIGVDDLVDFFPAWGYAGHWDGHGDHINKIFFPFWIVSALQWAVDTRDPISSAHGYVQNIMGWCKEHSPVHGLPWERLIEIGKKIYGSEAAFNPESGYECKAFPAYWHGQRSVMKDSLPVGDQVFPRIFSKHTPDNIARAGDLNGTQFEYAMFQAATGSSWTETEFEHHCERVIQLERQLLIRNFDRHRSDDEQIIPYFKRSENRINPFIGEPQCLEENQFKNVLNEYYDLRGWDKETGHPTDETVKNFDLPEM